MAMFLIEPKNVDRRTAAHVCEGLRALAGRQSTLLEAAWVSLGHITSIIQFSVM
jgi:hypothetical protein